MNKKRIQQIKCLFTLFFVVCASFYATRSYAQNNAVTIRLSGVSMERVMNEIENQTNYLFLSNKDVDINSVVSVDVEARPLSEALAQMVRGTDVVYRFDGKYILLSKADRRPVTVKGVVTDADGAPVIGASVIVKGTTVGASTNTDGSFSLQVPPPAENAVLTVTYLGYEPVDVTVGSRTDFRITLRDSAVAVENVVVTALGIKRQEKALSYNVQQVKSEELTTVKDANFMNSLVGKVAGVQINSGASGPGASARVVMRGEKSIEKGNNVLYVIDGIPMYNHSFGGDGGTYAKQAGSESAADINPEDIESINMLTGPSAAALYGSDAANGVVVINTKRGVKDRTVVTVSNSTTFSKVYRLPDMQNSYGTSSGLMNWGEKYASTFDAKKFFNTGTNIINSVSVSTGNEKNQTYISASTTNTAGIIPENTYDRYNFTARNTTSFAKDKLVLDLGASFIIQHDENMVTQGKYYNPLPALYLFPRSDDFDEIRLFERWDPVRGYMVQYWPYGEGAHSLQNPYWIQNRMNRETSKRRYMLNASLRWNITDWMNVSGRVRVDNSEYRIKQKLYASTLTTFCGTNGGYEDQTQHDRSFYGDVMLNIDKTFGDDWTLNANIGASINDQRYEQAGVAGDLLLTNHFAMNNLNYQEKFKPLQEGWHDQTQAIFASVEGGGRSMLCRRTDPHEDLFGGRRCCGRVGDAQFLFHGRRDVRQRSLVEVSQRSRRRVEHDQKSACGRYLVDGAFRLVDDRGEQFVLFLLVILLCALLELAGAGLHIVQFLLLHLLDGVAEGVVVFLEILQLGVEFDVHRLDVVRQLLGEGVHVLLHRLGLGHRHDDFLGVDASEFLGEERCGAHHQHNRKGQFDCFFHTVLSVNVLMSVIS